MAEPIPFVEGLVPEGLSETRFGLIYYQSSVRILCEVVDLRRKSGELWGELTVRCNLEGVRGQLDGNRLRQGNFNFSSMATRSSWAKALGQMCPPELNTLLEWGNVLERLSQEVLDHERQGAIHGQEIEGKRSASGGRPWATWPILPDHETATLFARGGAGKTSLVATMAFGMALGRSLIPGMRVDRVYRPVILDWETSAETAEDLLGVIAETHHVKVPKGIWYEPMDAPLERSLVKVANVIDKHKGDFVIIDSVMMAMVSSADGSGDPADSITRVYQSLRRLKTWGLLIDHVTGNDLRSRRVSVKAYGSIYKLNLARHSIALHIGQRDSDGDGRAAYLVCPKSNIGRDQWAMAGTVLRTEDELRWEFGAPDYDLYDRLMRERDENEDEDSRVAAELAKNATPKASGKYLAALHGSTGMTVKEVYQRVGVAASEAVVRTTLNHLASKEGWVYSSDRGGKEKVWQLTQAGIDFFANSQKSVSDA